MNYSEIRSILEKHTQTHLLKFYNELDSAGKQRLLRQISDIDWSLLSLNTDNSAGGRGSFSPLDILKTDEIEKRRREFEAAGLEALRNGKIAAVLLAGGQGSRLGFDMPKGCFNIGINRKLYIFECIMNNMLDTVRLCGSWFYLSVMTSEINYEETVSFFEEHDFFGFNKNYVRFFKQQMAPSIDFNGKIILESKDNISLSPNGNGGWFSSLDKAGILSSLKSSGVEWLSIFAVDNVLQRINDPSFVGATLLSGCQCGAKVIRKNAPDERIGVICLEDEKPSIVEYYETSREMRESRNSNGEYLYGFGVTLNYLFEIKALEKADISSLKYHVVEKKINCIDENGIRVCPAVPNGIKFEKLAVDVIHLLDSCLPYEIVRDYEFAPVKNLTGIDSVESARKLLLQNGIEL